MRTIYTCAGIGDSIWILQKLINQSEKFNWVLPGGNPRRGKQVFDLLPQITESCVYSDRSMKVRDIVKQSERGNWSSIKKQSFYLECNSHLEAGKRIEGWLADLKTSYTLPWVTSDKDRGDAWEILFGHRYMTGRPSPIIFGEQPKEKAVGDVDKKFIGIYTSAYQKDDRWKGWTAQQWHEFCMMFPPEYKFVVIGAVWDTNMSNDVLQLLGDRAINTVGQPLSVVIEIMKRLQLFVGFPSGLSILNETLACADTIMFYPRHLGPMMNTWADPARIESGKYKGCLWCEPVAIFNWLKDRL